MGYTVSLGSFTGEYLPRSLLLASFLEKSSMLKPTVAPPRRVAARSSLSQPSGRCPASTASLANPARALPARDPTKVQARLPFDSCIAAPAPARPKRFPPTKWRVLSHSVCAWHGAIRVKRKRGTISIFKAAKYRKTRQPPFKGPSKGQHFSFNQRKLLHEPGNDLSGRLDLMDQGGDLPDLQFPLVRIPFEHAPLGAGPTQKGL